LKLSLETDWGQVWAFGLRGDYANAWQSWERLREGLALVQLWPLIAGKRGEEEEVRIFASAYAANIDRATHNIEAVLARGLALGVDALMQQQDEYEAQWRAEHEAYQASPQYQVDLQAQREYEAREALEDEKYFAEYAASQDSEWHEDEPQVLEAPVPRHLPEEIWFFLVPAREGWEVPAVLCLGDWNACPPPHEHVALIHEWHQKYGAQFKGLSHDTMLFSVARPPQNDEEALLLGRQHLYFCPIESDEDVTPEKHAAWLLGRSGWFFWWD
jgi:hypothetical protein